MIHVDDHVAADLEALYGTLPQLSTIALRPSALQAMDGTFGAQLVALTQAGPQSSATGATPDPQAAANDGVPVPPVPTVSTRANLSQRSDSSSMSAGSSQV